MKEGWEYKKLGEVCERITDGSHNPPKGISSSEYMMISSQNVFNDSINLDDVRYLSKDDFLKEDKRTLIKTNDVLLTIVGTIGRCAVVSEGIRNFTLQRSVAVLSPSRIIEPRYLMFCCIGNNDNLNKNAHGVAQRGIYLRQLAKLEIPVPSLHIQKQIVSELDLLSGVIKKQKAQLEELDKLAQSIFYDIFGDPVTNNLFQVSLLGDIIDKLKYGTSSPPSFSPSGHKFIRATNIKNGSIVEDNMMFIDDTEASKLEKCKLTNRDLIIVRSGVNAGDVCRIGDEYAGQYAGYDIIITANTEMINTIFLNSLLNNRNYIDLVIKPLTRRAAQPHLNAQQVKSMSIPIPPFALQQEFALKIEAIESMKAKVLQSLKEAEKLFNSRINYYFN